MKSMNSCNNPTIVSMACIRALLMLFNILFWLSGLLLIWIGIWMQTDFSIYLNISSQPWMHGSYVLIGLGAVNLFITSLACSCIARPNPSMLVIYGAYLITMLFALISTSVYISTYKDLVISGVSKGIQHEISIYDGTTTGNTTETSIDVIQRNLHCCGNSSYLDWGTSRLPSSCCFGSESTKVCNRKEPKNIYSVGCGPKLRNLINKNLTSVGVTTSAIAFFPLFGTILAFALASVGEKILEYERLI